MKAWHSLCPLAAVIILGFAIEARARSTASHRSSDVEAKPAPSARPPLRPATTAPVAQSASAARDAFQRSFAREGTDASWAPGAGRLAASKLAKAVPAGSSVRSIECRTTMCRIETSHPDFDHYQAFVHQAFMDPGSSLWNAPTFSTNLGDSLVPPVAIVSYLAREGHSLPTAN